MQVGAGESFLAGLCIFVLMFEVGMSSHMGYIAEDELLPVK